MSEETKERPPIKYSRMPMEIDGVFVRLHDAGQGEAPNAVNAWKAILAHRHEKGQWFALPFMAAQDEKNLRRAYKALVMRMYRHGYTSRDLTTQITRRDGVCFCWHATGFQSEHERQERVSLIKHRRRQARTSPPPSTHGNDESGHTL